jgi:hypothetical protein
MESFGEAYKTPEPLPVDGGAPAPRGQTERSTLAVVSLIVGAISPVMLCTCVGPFVTAPVAIVLGHMALFRIGRSAGRLSGRGLAIAGLVLGYVSFVAAVGLVAALFLMRPSGPAGIARTAVDDRLTKAELAIVSDSKGTALGNSPEAIVLAGRFAAYMEAADKEAFTDSKAKLKLSGGHYVTWCELRPGRCAFVVHVPEYRRFTGDAKELLAKLAWSAAQRTVSSTLDEGDQLAVGLKGVLMYGAVMTGDVSRQEGEYQGLRFRTEDKSQLEPFFRASPDPDRKAVDDAGKR